MKSLGLESTEVETAELTHGEESSISDRGMEAARKAFVSAASGAVDTALDT